MTEIRTSVPAEVDEYLEAFVRKGIFSNKAELVRAALVNYVNATGTFFRGFDAETIFSPNGRIYQLEYAREASKRGMTALGIVCRDGVLLAAEVAAPSKLSPGVGKIRTLGPRLALALSGLVADGWLVWEELRAADPKTTDEAVRAVRGTFHRRTLDRNVRPLGVAVLLASALDRKPRLYYVDPSGTVVENLAAVMGRGEEATTERLEARYRKMRLSDAERLVPDLLGRETRAETVRVEA